MTMRLDRLEEEYGLEAREAAEAFAGDIYILTFQENRRGGDPVAHTPDGKTVFPDKFRGGDDIIPGDSWLCDVASKGGSTFFAAPLKRIDTALLMDLAADQMDRLVEVALRDHREALAPLLDEAVDKQADEVTRRRLAELQEAKETLEERLKDLEEQYDDAVQRVRHHEVEVRALRERLQDATDGQGAEADSEGPAQNGSPPREWTGIPGPTSFENGPVRVDRIGAEIVSSPAFVAERYYGHISPDRRRLFIKPHNNGNLPCVNGRIHIPGLERVVPFSGQARFVGSYDPRHGGWFVKL